MKLTVNTENLYYLNCSWEVTEIAEEVYKRCILDAQDLEEARDSLEEALDLEMIYTARQWAIMAEYQSPDEANYNTAYEEFLETLYRHFYEIVEEEEL